MGKSDTKNSSSFKGISLLNKICMVMISVAMIAVSVYGFLFLLLGMLPGIVALFTDKRAGKYASGTISTFNFIGVAPFLSKIWHSSNPAETASQMIVDPSVWLLVYGAAAVGWLVLWVMPQLGTAVLLTRADLIINKARASQRALVEEWGEDIVRHRK